jgi:hypothetical protein
VRSASKLRVGSVSLMGVRNGGGKNWGSDEVNIENWKALRRLVGHVAGECLIVTWEASGGGSQMFIHS